MLSLIRMDFLVCKIFQKGLKKEDMIKIALDPQMIERSRRL